MPNARASDFKALYKALVISAGKFYIYALPSR